MSDYIRRKMVLEYLQEQQANVIVEEHKHGFVSADVCAGMKTAVSAFMNFIVQAPTIEAVPVVHGEWVDDTGCLDSVRQYKCSNCGKKPIVNMNYVSILSDFCPNCGADMRKGGVGQ